MTEIPESCVYKVPIGLYRNAAMKLDSFITDIHEITEYEGLDPEHKQIFEQIAEISGTMLAAIVNMVAEEVGEEFLFEDVVMDEISENERRGF